jgi:hypothetical protein
MEVKSFLSRGEAVNCGRVACGRVAISEADDLAVGRGDDDGRSGNHPRGGEVPFGSYGE